MNSSLCRDTFYADNCGGSLERTRQTMWLLFWQTRMRPLPCRSAKKIPHVAYNETQEKPNFRQHDETLARS